jgi:hypothetical protein
MSGTIIKSLHKNSLREFVYALIYSAEVVFCVVDCVETSVCPIFPLSQDQQTSGTKISQMWDALDSFDLIKISNQQKNVSNMKSSK